MLETVVKVGVTDVDMCFHMHLLEIFKEAGNRPWFSSAGLTQEVTKCVTTHPCALTALMTCFYRDCAVFKCSLSLGISQDIIWDKRSISFFLKKNFPDQGTVILDRQRSNICIVKIQ